MRALAPVRPRSLPARCVGFWFYQNTEISGWVCASLYVRLGSEQHDLVVRELRLLKSH